MQCYTALVESAGGFPDGVRLRRDFVRAKFMHRSGADKQLFQATFEPSGFAAPAAAGGALEASVKAEFFGAPVVSPDGAASDFGAVFPLPADA